MKLHFYTKKASSFSYNSIIKIMEDERFFALNQKAMIGEILNSDDVLDIISDNDWSELTAAIEPLFDKTTNGVFDWNKKTGEYYVFFNEMLHDLNCSLENEAGEVFSSYYCELSDRGCCFHDHIISLYIPNFYSGNGEPVGAQLALEMAEHFMNANQWHIGFYDANELLITDIASWAKNNMLDIRAITPVVWFGHDDDITECWSLTPKTSDLFIKEFWGDYYEGALLHICDADAGLGIYYSVWEYGLEYDSSIFEDIKSHCPINIDLANEERTNALYNLIVSIYNNNKGAQFPEIQKDLYLQDVIDCVIEVTCEAYSYSYSKPYRFKPCKLPILNRDNIEEILLEDKAYNDSFNYLEETIIDKCDLGSCYYVWERVSDVISQVQEQMNSSFICHIYNNENVLATIPYSIDFKSTSFLPKSEIINIVFIKSLIEFLKRGRWHIGYREASQLPQINNAYTKVLPQEGTYPIVWFNDSEEIDGKLGIWPAQDQYMLHLYWESASDFCSHVFNNIEIHNKFENTGSPLYKELEQVFEHVKEQCPIRIRKGINPVDFKELEDVVKNKS